MDLLVDEKRGLDEAWKAFIMLGIAMVFFLTMQGPWGFLKDWVRGASLKGYLTFISLHTAFSLLIVPAIFLVFSYLSKSFSGAKEVSLKKIFTNFSYTLVPLGLGVWIAFSVGIVLPNGSYIYILFRIPLPGAGISLAPEAFPGLRYLPGRWDTCRARCWYYFICFLLPTEPVSLSRPILPRSRLNGAGFPS